MGRPPASASPAVFYADMARLNAELDRLDAIIDLGYEGRFVDPTKVPQGFLAAYARLCEYGYANNLLP